MLRKYEIVLIDEEVAYMYSGMEKKLYQLFQENVYSKGFLKTLTTHQIRYITKDYKRKELNEYIYHSFFHKKDYSYSDNTHTLNEMKNKNYAQLTLYPGKMILTARGSIDAETSFFEVLRNYQPFFLALNHDTNKFGWLRPIQVMNIMDER
ncbi:sporulation inhibitor of replication protein SirA [Salipaludibacillus daqingensis]|uniref:sporulation inhibitor of replication protein SirA n=1 Tax=Salipaludibacillus daqingensis TaxID=3041001 RepID=UPI0024739B32|nr:sporulation inhibitor of replication protein SirA [Salipaludibacillus daqingensis]